MSLYRVEPLTARASADQFDCGVEILNRYLSRHALQNQFAGAAQTYLAMRDDRAAGFYSLAVGQLEFDDAPERLKRGVAAHPVPIMLIARLAIDLDHQGKAWEGPC